MSRANRIVGHPIKVSLIGSDAVLLDAAGEQFDETVQRRIWGLARRVLDLAYVVEAAPGMNNLLVSFRSDAVELEALIPFLQARWDEQQPAEETGRTVEAPTVYGGEGGADLFELAARVGLTPSEVARMHAAPAYSVAAVGAMPGFAYLSGLDPILAWPRLATPRMAVTGGSVIIGGRQAGVMPYTAPSGWRSIGMTQLRLFDIDRDPAVLLQPGDRLRFQFVDLLA